MKKKIFFIFFYALLVAFGIEISDCLNAADYTLPERTELSEIASKETLTQSDYELIFLQTGLGKRAVDELREENDTEFYQTLLSFQTQCFSPVETERRYLFFPTTIADVLKDGEGVRRLQLPPLKNGDILITKSTKTLLYRHGHAAIVVDADRGRVVEAMMLGMPSGKTFIDGWESYGTLAVLRPKTDKETIKKAVEFAEKKMVGVPYRLLTGIIDKDKSDNNNISSTHCSHLVWQAYRASGIELDSDGGWLVSPGDLFDSEELELVFSYGFAEKKK